MNGTIEQQVTRELEQQTARYESARTVAARIAQAVRDREEISADMAQLGLLMHEAAGSADTIKALQEEWSRQGRPASDALRSAVESHTAMLRGLIELVQSAELSAIDARDALRPQLDAAARDRQAVDRYRQAAEM